MITEHFGCGGLLQLLDCPHFKSYDNGILVMSLYNIITTSWYSDLPAGTDGSVVCRYKW